ncbi:MAG: flagellar export chaperone FliS [Lachnospiraceae bacterium]|nr:flagellar export chaperone FliS [Lachnospiraceae bacterium]
MIMNMNTYAQQYQRNKILTASPAELTLMLYEGGIKFTNMAIHAVEEKDYESANANIKKVERVIGEFKVTLDHKYEVAKDFDRIYDYLLERLLDASISKDKVILEEIAEHLRSMRDNWKEVMKAAAAGNSQMKQA